MPQTSGTPSPGTSTPPGAASTAVRRIREGRHAVDAPRCGPLAAGGCVRGNRGDQGPGGTVRVALWRADAGDRTHREELRAAAWRACSLWAPVVAERLAGAALESGLDLEGGFVLSEALSDQSKPRDALEAWRAVEELTQAVTQGDLSPTYVLGLGVGNGHPSPWAGPRSANASRPDRPSASASSCSASWPSRGP